MSDVKLFRVANGSAEELVDVRDVGHHGTGDLELTIRNLDDLDKAKPLIQRSFEEN